RGHPRRVDLNLELAQVAPEPFDRGDTWYGEQSVFDLELGEVAERHQVDGAGLGFERELQNLVEAAGQTRHQRGCGAGRERCRDLTDAFGDQLTGAIVVGVGLEFDGHLAHTQL